MILLSQIYIFIYLIYKIINIKIKIKTSPTGLEPARAITAQLISNQSP